MNPKPCEHFEFAGLTWDWEAFGHGRWSDELGDTPVGITRWLADGRVYYRSAWDPDNVRHDTPEAACLWAIRTCPGARCGSCLYHKNRRCCRAINVGTLVREDGWCHQWNAMR